MRFGTKSWTIPGVIGVLAISSPQAVTFAKAPARAGKGAEAPAAVFRGSAQRTGRSPSADIAKAPRPKWNVPAGSAAPVGPVTDGESLYLLSGQTLRVVNVRTGKQGRIRLPFKIDSAEAGGALPFTISDRVIYTNAVAADGQAPEKAHYFVAYDLRRSRAKWNVRTAGPAVMSPAFHDGVVYFGSADGTLYAAEAQTGKEKWKFEVKDLSMAPVVVGEKSVFVVGTKGGRVCFAVDIASGEEKWRYRGFNLRALAYSDGVVYARTGSTEVELVALDAATGKQKWKLGSEGTPVGCPAVSDGTLYFASKKAEGFYLNAVHAGTGEVKWRFATGKGAAAYPLATGKAVYFAATDPKPGGIFAVDVATGEQIWKLDIELENLPRERPLLVQGTLCFIKGSVLHGLK